MKQRNRKLVAAVVILSIPFAIFNYIPTKAHVVDAKGDPVPNAKVIITCQNLASSIVAVYAGISDASGNVTFWMKGNDVLIEAASPEDKFGASGDMLWLKKMVTAKVHLEMNDKRAALPENTSYDNFVGRLAEPSKLVTRFRWKARPGVGVLLTKPN
jgi:hypothetical protein